MQNFECLAFVKGTGYSVVDTSWGPVRIGVYARHLSKWLKHFSSEQLLFVSGERLISDPAAEIGRVQVCKFVFIFTYLPVGTEGTYCYRIKILMD